ncbi:MAG: 2-(3-amino-3-carboxypropyl)histidine synthase [Candidatus Diapherotrites archaeon ADurb.Bin253]|jgi:2-(3-amino-3-carboxypropyl)histidine synthase|nr:MAG: 2-(3-amino-3-carboxypropyl)histidine synthase [Candidatus Diapherotrites archaeon ADurb.Bin253]HNZ51879.1 diphthamide biosynthesis enzyme Dph2 [Candidatus Pacearchaeota archaeon]HOH04147.1 diphthamide biosynthesis enzyme Dph2 [Candidatus Pacearchaeota archaeon]HPX74844.1 diphthamide biosynthesis enzyme Dph2 [Candidatus Pacearchaeota archaeon]HQC61267.1 diphthamide biosynthesis enzyme Dph2 [Candidatus Pacearchaeota archaeon]
MAFNFETEKLRKHLEKIKPKRVLVQLPEGVKQNSFELLEFFEKLKIEAIFSGETCWGGCAVAVEEAKSVKADLIVHFGHSEFMKVNFPVIYIPIKDELNLESLLKKSLFELKSFKNIGLSCSVQHIHDLKNILEFYENNGKKVIVSKKKGNVSGEGQVVGCQYFGLKEIQDKVDCFVVVGNNFHSMGAALAVDKPVFLIDVYNNEIKNMNGVKDKILRQRILSVEKFKDAKKIGIIIGVKQGQQFGSYKYLKDRFIKLGKEVVVLTINEFSPDKLVNFYNIDGFVELACPRIATDDFARYKKPIITFKEALVVVGEKSWDDLIKEGLL